MTHEQDDSIPEACLSALRGENIGVDGESFAFALLRQHLLFKRSRARAGVAFDGAPATYLTDRQLAADAIRADLAAGQDSATARGTGMTDITAANDPLFEAAYFRLKAAAGEDTPNHGIINHVIGEEKYGEIEFIQCGDEVDILYRLEPVWLEKLSGCAVHVTLGGAEHSLGVLDAEGKATLTLPLHALPPGCHCRFVRPEQPDIE